MHLDIRIGPYEIIQRTEFSKVQLFKKDTNENITSNNEEVLKKILSDYYAQKENPEKYFEMDDTALISVNEKAFSIIKYLFIPDYITELGTNVFENKNFIYASIPESINTIKNFAFADCEQLKEITLPDSVKELGFGAFANCSSLESVKLSSKIEKILDRTFSYCKSLCEITIPDSVTDIGARTFMGCENLKSVSLSNCLEFLEAAAFYECGELEKINLPDTLKSISTECFNGCKSLREITIPSQVKEIFARTFFRCENLETINLSEGLKVITKEAFSKCKKLSKITIPDSVNSIDMNAFKFNESLKKINIPKDLYSVKSYMYAGSGIESLEFKHDLKSFESKTAIFDYDLISFSSINRLIISNSVKKIIPSAFNSSGGLIRTIDYKGTKKEFENFKNNNKELFENLFNLEKVNFIDEKEIEKTKKDER